MRDQSTLPRFGPEDALLAVDVQNDFCPGGKLAVPEGDAVVPVLNRWIRAASAGGALIVASRDWHPLDHGSFSRQRGPWPEHCVQGSPGAEIRRDLVLPSSALILSKGDQAVADQYSAFDRTGLAEALHRCGVERIWVGGLALDGCVRATALDAIRAGFETHVILAATRPVSAENGARALAELAARGAVLEGGEGDG